jgi:hypothetical protein
LLREPVVRVSLARALHHRVTTRYSPDRILSQVCAVYDGLVGGREVSLPVEQTTAA